MTKREIIHLESVPSSMKSELAVMKTELEMRGRTTSRPGATLRALMIVAAVLLPSASARASIVRAASLAELTTVADRVVVGEVLSVRSDWNREHTRIFTFIEVQVAELWKGSPCQNGKLTIVQAGGSVGDLETRVHGQAEFSEGDRAVLFLRGRDDASTVLGLGQGVRPLAFDDKAKRWMVLGGERSAAVIKDAGGRLVPAGPEEPHTLEALRTEVKKLVKAASAKLTGPSAPGLPGPR